MMRELPPEYQTSALWIFGYGSLVWKPDFEYTSCKVGFIRGYNRRFWHGDTFHRGNEKMPGRVVTLVEECDACTWGVAYEIRDHQIAPALDYLCIRESKRGGYKTQLVEFIPREEEVDCDGINIMALVYIATPENPIYLGPAPPEQIAAEIAISRGQSGHNLEYLIRLADFMRLFCPDVEDDHLFAIEAAAITILPYLYDTELSFPLLSVINFPDTSSKGQAATLKKQTEHSTFVERATGADSLSRSICLSS
ncbi:glutathione-specific gamma-glutamylcyclotransferase 1 [Protopterus annectens]|uniref:glutathione-specific gamma-glutamylcyclotransferase 1 n=1 Tax=Protopterus annectens TaxID=7888 RepID=UPI001CFC3BFB|nr:glutathione-specific gamma-glutamylcyclotransferase 1 [Protopterus annectens]